MRPSEVFRRIASSEHELRCRERRERAQVIHGQVLLGKQLRAAELLWQSIGRRYESCTLDTFHAHLPAQQTVLGQLREYAARIRQRVAEGVNVLLIGPSGAGKDHLLAGLVHVALAEGLSIRWQTGGQLWLHMRDAIQGGCERQAIEELVRPDVLVLSDPIPPHAEPSNYERSILYAIVDRRYSHLRPIWMSANVASRQQADERLGHAVADRLRHGALVLGCWWPSYRRSDSA
jgi:DNA replication protein DnaC